MGEISMPDLMMSKRKLVRIVATIAALTPCFVWGIHRQLSGNAGKALTPSEFQDRMEQLANAWNAGNARAAADLFADDALYSSPPSSKVREGQVELFEWFGGARGRTKPMRMVWHHLIFDEAQQIGAGEYTFTYEVRTHGMVLIRLRDGKIANWREYEIESPSDWEALVGKNRF
jgi:ketosteroid isomerase-like protein